MSKSYTIHNEVHLMNDNSTARLLHQWKWRKSKGRSLWQPSGTKLELQLFLKFIILNYAEIHGLIILCTPKRVSILAEIVEFNSVPFTFTSFFPTSKLYTRASHFTVSTMKDVFQLLQKDDWAIILDLNDTYFHVLLSVRHHRVFFSSFGGDQAYRYAALPWYRYAVLPFGLSDSPLCFIRVTKPVVQHPRDRGYMIMFSLDHVLLLLNS